MSTKKKPEPLTTAWLRAQLAALIPDAGERTLKLAYSGGLDSHVLLHLLAQWCQENNTQFTAIHVDHCLSPHSREWSQHCVDICTQLDVSLVVEQVSVHVDGKGLEDAAREARYQALEKHMSPNDVLITAHHRDDQVETVLLQLVRGTGAHGLAGMAVKRNFANGFHIRPLLEISRNQITDYAHQHHLQWVDDDTNADTALGRNYMRHEIVPVLRVRWPGVEKVIARSAGHAAAAVELLEEIAEQDRQQCGLADDGLSLQACDTLSEPRLRNLLRYWVRRSGLSLPATRHINEIARQIRRPSTTSHAIITWPGGVCYRYRDRLLLSSQPASEEYQYDIEWDPAESVVITPLGIKVSANSVMGQGLALARLGNATLHLRHRHGGETLQLSGRAHHHKLKKLFQEAGVPPWERRKLPLLYVDGELAAVGDRWVVENFAAAPNEPGLAMKISHI